MCVYCFHTNAPFASGSADPNSGYKEKLSHHPWYFLKPSNGPRLNLKRKTFIADILQIDAFVSLFKWLGESHIGIRLSGTQHPTVMQFTKSCEILSVAQNVG